MESNKILSKKSFYLIIEVINEKIRFLDRLLDLSGRNTSLKTEVFAGITTFMTIAYILAVIPGNLSETGIPRGAVFTATIISTIFATLIAGLYANLPFVFSTVLRMVL